MSSYPTPCAAGVPDDLLAAGRVADGLLRESDALRSHLLMSAPVTGRVVMRAGESVESILCSSLLRRACLQLQDIDADPIKF